MDMDMGMGDVDPAIANLPVSDPRCVAAAEMCTAFYSAENQSQAITPWLGQFAYGRWITYYYLGVIGIATFFYALHRLQEQLLARDLSEPRRLPSPLLRVRALVRSVTYRNWSGRNSYWLALPSFGMLSFLTVTLVFVVALVFSERPYYRAHLGYGSPPIAIRSGLMAFACTPILVSLAGKANLISFLTGLGHERLNVIHRWVGWITFALSLIHTIPFFVASYREGGADRLRLEFYRNLMPSEISVVPALAMLFGLCVLSLPNIRDRVHETFYYSHVVIAITYLGLLYYHAANVEDSWAYLWATFALWLASWLARAFWKNQATALDNNWFQGDQATLQSLPGGMTRIETYSRKPLRHRPGQHVYLRFPDVSPLESHPFTIVRSSSPQSRKAQEQAPLTFLVRSHRGHTKRLAAMASKSIENSTSVWVDGPYGGISEDLVLTNEKLVLVAGGSGITAAIAWLPHATMSCAAGIPVRTKAISIVYIMRESDSFDWVSDILAEELAAKGDLQVDISFFVTGQGGRIPHAESTTLVAAEKAADVSITPVAKTETGRSASPVDMAQFGTVSRGRPDFKHLLGQLVHDTGGRRLRPTGYAGRLVKRLRRYAAVAATRSATIPVSASSLV